MFYKGIVLGKIKKHEEALNCFESVSKRYPSHLDALFHMGIEHAELERHNKAIEIFNKILSKHKDNVNIIYAKSRSEAALGNYSEAMGLLKKAILLNSKTIRKWAKKEKIFEKLHDNEQFRKMVKL